jgi:hypothetical protein
VECDPGALGQSAREHIEYTRIVRQKEEGRATVSGANRCVDTAPR